MQLIYSVCGLHLQSDDIQEDIKLQSKYLIMLIQQFLALVKLVHENRENTADAVPNTIFVFHSNTNTQQSAAYKLHCTIQHHCQSQ